MRPLIIISFLYTLQKFPSLASSKHLSILTAAEEKERFERLLKTAIPDYCVAGNDVLASSLFNYSLSHIELSFLQFVIPKVLS